MGKEDHGDALGEIQSVEKALGRRSQFLQQINGKRGVCVCVCVCVCEREREREREREGGSACGLKESYEYKMDL